LLKSIGMERNQYVLAAHQDTQNYHAHVIGNRIGPNGKANDLWQERIKRERVCAEIAAERGWEIVVGRHNRDIVQRVRHLYAPPPDPERRLSDGAYRRLYERGELPWQESARPYVLDAVDRASSWSELHERLAAHGVVAKLVRRSEKIRGLAFAEGFERGAPGCAASRIDARCGLQALERRFGACPYTPEQPPKRSRNALGDRAGREACSDPRWALRDAQRIADHARLRSEYRAYRDRYFSERAQAMAACRDAAWERERAQRQCDAQRRREARLLLRAVARLGTRGVIARQLAYWSVDVVIGRRRAKEYDGARVRWEATKIVLASERGLTREEKPLAYRSFVTERARAGDVGARRVLDALVAPTRDHSEHVTPRELRPVTLAEIRLRLDVIRAEEERRCQRAQLERQHLERVERPPTLDEALANERRRIHERTAEATRCTDVERVRLAQLAKDKRSWNPLARRAAAMEEERLCGEQRSRYEKSLADATQEFEERHMPQRAAGDGPRSRPLPCRWCSQSAWSGKVRRAKSCRMSLRSTSSATPSRSPVLIAPYRPMSA
jgi:hypothetical protein